MPNISWGDAFASAANIQPEELDEDFLRRTSEKNNTNDRNASGIRRVSEFALLMRNSSSNNIERKSLPSSSPCATEQDTNLFQDSHSVSEKKKSKKSKKIKKSKKEKKKRSRKKSDDQLLNQDNDYSSEDNDKKMIKIKSPPKKKKKTEKHLSSSVRESDDLSNRGNEDEETCNTLEGRLYDNDVVLIDKSSGKVFSGGERDSRGNHVQIGTLDSNDEVILFHKGLSLENSNSGMYHVVNQYSYQC